MADTIADTRRLFSKPQNLNDAYGPPSNFLEIDVSNPETVGVGRNRFTTYEIRLKAKFTPQSNTTPCPKSDFHNTFGSEHLPEERTTTFSDWSQILMGRPRAKIHTNLPIFKLKESRVRRRYSDFEWLRGELERDSKVVVPPLPGKALFRQLPFRGDDGIFDDAFIEERRAGLEQFLNKVAGHPLAQNERCLHMFLQDESVDKTYTPSKIRQA
uniref:PX domain-containing protein n=1 Tax=Esox lucius TaxID=8010 RepID=A0AAY5K2H6_ESOLU